ncbi:unnamed protein product [Symbiodinium natans]|uniref:Uncharacterized protein n=1 Tax=Symbiodinium natans TaxID=878477 RepID=A0A812IM52_9DINO|nr:unnamed protein product [Symbiodinium natans]
MEPPPASAASLEGLIQQVSLNTALLRSLLPMRGAPEVRIKFVNVSLATYATSGHFRHPSRRAQEALWTKL